MARTLETRSILEMCNRQKGFFSASFRDDAKRIYVLEIVGADPPKLEVLVQAPQGRSTPIDPNSSWVLTFWNQRGAYQTRVMTFNNQSELLRATVHKQTVFLARRKNIRLATDSRNPTELTFQTNGQVRKGFLVDFSVEGLGLEIGVDQGFEAGQILYNGYFKFKGYDISFDAARIVQRSWSKSRLRLGLAFEQLSELQEEAVRLAFNQCFSLHPTISTVLDG